jgi:hypothetical protein
VLSRPFDLDSTAARPAVTYLASPLFLKVGGRKGRRSYLYCYLRLMTALLALAAAETRMAARPRES